jgi:hypothetical protein
VYLGYDADTAEVALGKLLYLTSKEV